MKTNTLFVILVSLFTGLAFLKPTHAVVPPPDGGYPGFNTAEGTNALKNLTTGVGNAAVGWYSLFSNTDGSFNTAVGAGTLLFNTGDQSTGDGIQNTAVGTGALLFNAIGSGNTAVGTIALENNTEGRDNTAVGVNALFANTTGDQNTAVGVQALSANTTRSENTAVGYQALFTNTDGFQNTAIGSAALINNHDGFHNTATGHAALQTNNGGSDNTATGNAALGANSSGSDNTAVGAFALQNTNGNMVTAVGSNALVNNTSGNDNTAVGGGALFNNSTGGLNTALGSGAGTGVTTASNVICIGHPGANVSDSCYIGNIFSSLSSGGVGVFINSDGKLGTNPSSHQFKEQIKLMEEASEALFALKPVTFRYKKELDPAGTSQFGLVAEEVEKVNPDLIVRNKEGKPYSVRYDQVNAMLLNEFLKEHKAFVQEKRKVQEQGATIARLEQRIEELTVGLQKVSAQLELNKAAPQTVSNNQ